jgi:NO-binding membrane sensor protein with MHYT domain
MKMISDFLDRYFLPAFRWLALGICIAVALNFVAFWWHWEVRLSAWGATPSRFETLNARLALLWAVATLAFGAAFFDLLKVPTKVRRRSVALFSLAVASGVTPYLIRRFLLS